MTIKTFSKEKSIIPEKKKAWILGLTQSLKLRKDYQQRVFLGSAS